MKKLTTTILTVLSLSTGVAFASTAADSAPCQAETIQQVTQSQTNPRAITGHTIQLQVSDTAQRNQVNTLAARCPFAVTAQAKDSQSVPALLATTEPEPEPEPAPSPLSFPKPGPIRV